MQLEKLPWSILFGTSFFSLSKKHACHTISWNNNRGNEVLVSFIFSIVTHLIENFSSAVTYNLFITLGLITSVPVSAGV